ncbi:MULTISPECIES: aminotransferase class V-fold PLP-dependent enzyme [Saccharomonospora]|uniref:Selenocysteine lyase n=2 Tax=Saccharomonospora TaxID=1851 RepID=I1D4H3_9PSEU|nr:MULTISPECIES: aminotransferase class V-fold PLP-dependent enzyme [Saccharomonospora]EHY87449.1 selenocysteine lyase [Saccharomonospora azurea NA-128]EIE99847.1 selenocysteine lyase [Saccharomonospora glauca K62]
MTAAAVHTFDVERARRETPGCENVVHLNNAGAALMPTPVLDRTVTHLKLEARVGGYEAAALVAEEIEDVYGSAARLLGCRTDEIAVVDSATRAWDMAFYSVPFRPGDRILTSEAEYASNFIAYLQLAQRYNLRVDVVPNGESGQISVPRLRDLIDERVRLISLTHVPTNGGLVNPAAEVGKVARDAGVLYLLDACQSAGQMSLDVDEIGCDMVSMTGRKYLRGPRGTGLLYVRREVLDELAPPMLDLHAATWVARDEYRIRPDARRFESWECNYAAKLGLGAAIDYALGWGLDRIRGRVYALADELRLSLAQLPQVTVHDAGVERCGIVSFTVDGVAPADVQAALGAHGINVSVSRTPSTRLDMENRGLEELVRASVHYYNTCEELAMLCDVVRDIGPRR